jgi:hypothetical protein
MQKEKYIAVGNMSKILGLQLVHVFTSGIAVTNLDFENITIKKFLGFVTQSKAAGLSTASEWFFGLRKPGII